VELLLAAAAIAIYFVPAMLGASKRNAAAIFTLNLFLGWTLLGWVIALTWALTKDDLAPAAVGQKKTESASGLSAQLAGTQLAMRVAGNAGRLAYIREHLKMGDLVALLDDEDDVAVTHNGNEIGIVDLAKENAARMLKRLARGQECAGFILDIDRDEAGQPVLIHMLFE
jgi:hypothetical protein